MVPARYTLNPTEMAFPGLGAEVGGGGGVGGVLD